MTELPPGWTRTEIGTVAETQLGKMLSKKSKVGTEPRPYLRNKSVQWSRIDLHDLPTMDFDPDELERFEVLNGDLLVCEGGEVGRAAIWRGQLEWVGYQKALHRVRPRGRVAAEFLLYCFMWLAQSHALEEHVTGSTIKHLPQEDLRQIAIPLPPLNEQRRIVAAIEEHLSRLDAAKALLSSSLQRIDALGRAAMADALDQQWPTTPLGELAIRITKGTTPTSLGRTFTATGARFIKAESLAHGVINHERCAHIDEETDALLGRSRLAEHDVLVTIAGTLGRVAVVRASDLPANTNQAVSLVRLKETRAAPWVATWLRGPKGQAALTMGGRGVGLQNLNLKQVADVAIPVPPLGEQRRIVARIEDGLSAIDALRSAVERSQRRSASLRRAVLEGAFRGDLVPQDPADEPASVLLERIRLECESTSVKRRRRRVQA